MRKQINEEDVRAWIDKCAADSDIRYPRGFKAAESSDWKLGWVLGTIRRVLNDPRAKAELRKEIEQCVQPKPDTSS